MSRSLFRYVLIDVPSGFCPTSIAAAEMSDTTYLMTMLSGTYELQHLSRAREMFQDWEDMDERLKYLRNLEERKESVLASIEEQGKLTDELKKQMIYILINKDIKMLKFYQIQY